MRYGRRVERNPAPFPIGGQQVRNSAAIHARLLAISKRVLRRLQHHLGRVDVPSEKRRAGQLSGASFSGGGHGLLAQNPRSWLNASALCANWPERRSTTFFQSKGELPPRPHGLRYGRVRVAVMGIPMTSPATTSSTRRLRCLPAAVSFEATGIVFPKPCAPSDMIGMPCPTRKSRTARARFSDSTWLKSSVPTLSV